MQAKSAPVDVSPNSQTPSLRGVEAGVTDRRSAMLATVAAVALGVLPAKAAAALCTSTGDNFPGLPDKNRLHNWVRQMVDFGQRYTGTRAHNDFIDYLQGQFEALGLAVTRNTEALENWEAGLWELSVGKGPKARKLPVAAYYSYSGETPTAGVEADVIWLDGADPKGRDVRGRIVAFRRKYSLKLVREAVLRPWKGDDGPLSSFQDSLIRMIKPSRPDVSMDNNLQFHVGMVSPLNLLKDAGALGVIIVEDDVPALSLNGAYMPFRLPYQGIPALFVDGATGDAIERAGNRVRLTLLAKRNATTTAHLAAVIPGMSDEVIVLATHTDGLNAIQENGAIGLLALAHHLTSLPKRELPRTIAIVGVTGHMSPMQPRALEAWFASNPDIRARTVACIAIEHLGATEWSMNGDHSSPTGKPEQGMCFISDHGEFRKAVIAAFDRAELENTALLRPVSGWLPGAGAAAHKLGIPSVSYLAAPPYLICWDKRDHIDKFNASRMHDELKVFADLVHAIGEMKGKDLQLLDSPAPVRG